MIQFNTQTKHQTFFKNIFLKFSIFKQTELIYILFFLSLSPPDEAQSYAMISLPTSAQWYWKINTLA